MNASSRWRPVCLAVQADDGLDAAAVKQWLQSNQSLNTLDLSDQGLASTAGPTADSLATDKQASPRPCHYATHPVADYEVVLSMQAAASNGTEYVLTVSGKVRAIQKQLDADKAAALAADHDVRVKKELDCSNALKVDSYSACQPFPAGPNFLLLRLA